MSVKVNNKIVTEIDLEIVFYFFIHTIYWSMFWLVYYLIATQEVKMEINI